MTGRSRLRPRWLAGADGPAETTRTTDEVPESTRVLVLARAGHHCESCGASLVGRPYSLHHRRPKGMGGTRAELAHSPANLVALCGLGNNSGCHGLVHQHPTAAQSGGFVVRRAADPTRIPVALHDGRLVLLTAAGGYEAVSVGG
ncbi:HNH endonuclease [Frankia sp. AgPm24]|uniref:HNH endonuclease n=1 Tax=Frankia sp. AgPm24 TaxID=631128 RepID=UPI00200FB55A|nr:HNH endonuclease signature motif containing protein [Frankia sp. AgPm24]MCK9921626.1 HNH endonuclease [Frankia sp. AgPm24]